MNKAQSKMGRIDFVIFINVMLLVAIGVVMVYSASSYTAFFSKNYNYDSMFFLKKQLMWSVIGIVAMVIGIKTDYHKLKKYTPIIVLITVILLIVVLFSPEIKGARRWINLGPANIQPSEIAKYVVVLVLAKTVDSKGEKMKSFFNGVVPCLIIAGFFAFLILLEKNLSITSVVMIVALIIIFTSGAKIWNFIGLFPVFILGVFALTILVPYRMQRLLNFRDPWKDALDKGYQLVQSLLAIGAGGIFGVGLGQSRQKCYYIPEPHNDFIFSIIAEELGLIGCIFIISLYILFIYRGIKVSVNAKDVYGSTLAVGITSVIAVQAIINIAVVSGSMPVTGVPLPFISYGGSSLLFNMFSMGILLNVSRQVENKNKVGY